MKKTFFVTTPIYYGSGLPHLGSFYSTLLADVLARWHKLQGYEVYFLTGTDEHGQKIAEKAQQEGKTPQDLVDEYAKAYKNLWREYDIEYTKFIRTTDLEHKKAVKALAHLLFEKGDIYKGEYTGWYCTPCETFVPSNATADQEGPVCPSCGRATRFMTEPCYFFRLSAYQERLLAFFKQNPDFIVPKERANEVVAFIEAGLKDLSISRSTITWGIPFPDDPEHVIYVWLDALTNYISAIGYADATRVAEFNHWWPVDVHVIGKDIVRFHAVYWLAFLMAAELPLPKHELVHGWIVVEGQKMSKSRGNVVDPVQLKELYGVDGVRYYLTSRMAITQDASFSIADLEKVISQDLANELGNLLNRMAVLAQKYDALSLPVIKGWSPQSIALCDAGKHMTQLARDYLNTYQFHLAYAEVKRFTALVNSYVHEREPWVQAGTDKQAFIETLSAVSHSLQLIAHVLWPVMPRSMEKMMRALGKSLLNGADVFKELVAWDKSFTLMVVPPLFAKVEGVFADLQKTEEAQTNKAVASDSVKAETAGVIDIADFVKVQLVAGTIIHAEMVPNSDKLLKLQVNCGVHGMRQILAGIKLHYKPEDLIGQQGIFVLNLKPRKLLGLESQGMLLCAVEAGGKTVFLRPSQPINDGSGVR